MKDRQKYGIVTGPGTVRFERLLPGPIEKVWAYLTESEKRGKWLAKGHMDLFEGGKVTLNFLHRELSPVKDYPPERYKNMEFGHTFTGKILKISPPNLLAFTWEGNSEVTIELKEVDRQVLLILTHVKLAENIVALSSVAAGWHTHLEILMAQLLGQTPCRFWTMHSEMEEEYFQILSI